MKQDTLTIKKVEKLLDRKLKSVSKQLDSHGKTLAEVNQRLDSHTISLDRLEQIIPAIGDIHEMLKDYRKEQRELETRVDNLEPRVDALEAVVGK